MQRLCIEFPLEEPVIPFIHIGNHKQHVQYEGEKLFCKNCRRLGHVAAKCQIKKAMPTVQSILPNNISPQPNKGTNAQKTSGEVWQTVNFTKKKRVNGRGNEAIQKTGIINKLPHGIPGKLSTQYPNTSYNFPRTQNNFKTKIITYDNDLSTKKHVTRKTNFLLWRIRPWNWIKKIINSKMILGCKTSDVASKNQTNDYVSSMKEASSTNM